MSAKQEQIAVVHQFGRTYRSFLSAFEAQVGQPMPRWRILLAISDGGRVSQKSLVEKLQIDAGALTRQLKSIEALGWIARSVDERDNRVTNVELTDAGRAAVAQGMPARNRFLDAVLDDFPESLLKSLSQGLDLLERHIVDASAGGAPRPPARSASRPKSARGALEATLEQGSSEHLNAQEKVHSKAR